MTNADEVGKPEPEPDYRHSITESGHERRRRRLRHPICLHPSVSDELREAAPLYNRLGLILEQLGATAETSIAKRCRAPNQGWRRTPLGTRGDLALHLWWTPKKSPAAEGIEAPPGAVIVRAVREQGDNRKLDAGDRGDYLELADAGDVTADIAGEPWTYGQMEARRETAPAVVLAGLPGTGKTTALWHAIDDGDERSVLYVTWSARLAATARTHFDSFSAADTTVRCIDFAGLVGELTGSDVELRTERECRDAFDAALARTAWAPAGDWQRYPGALYAEVRAKLVGDAQPGTPGTVIEHGLARLKAAAYEQRRAGAAGIGRRAAQSAARAADAIGGAGLAAILPELAAATAAWTALGEGNGGDRFDGIERIVVDEAQDLTVLETSVIVELASRIERRSGRRPALLVAGDSGQRVRPTGFEWSRIANVIAADGERPVRVQAGEHVRCPEKIARVIDRATGLYMHVKKDRRPTRQGARVGGEHVEGHLLHVVTGSTQEAAELVDRLVRTDGVAVTTPETEPPAWVHERARSGVLDAAAVKGLEYETAVVLETGRNLLQRAAAEKEDDPSPLREEQERTAVDRLRVCLSRATETLVLVDVDDSNEQVDEATEGLVGHEAPKLHPADLIEHLEARSGEAEEQVERLIGEAEALGETAPERAWERACQALALAGDPALPNAVSDPRLRRRVRRSLMECLILRLSADAARGEPESERGEGAIAKRALELDVEIHWREEDRARARPTGRRPWRSASSACCTWGSKRSGARRRSRPTCSTSSARCGRGCRRMTTGRRPGSAATGRRCWGG